MTRGRHHQEVRAAPCGAWLAFLALAIQVLLPFLVAYEIALAGNPAYADTPAICHAPDSLVASGQPATDRASHHGLSDGCPICVAFAASQAFLGTTPAALPLPHDIGNTAVFVVPSQRASLVAAASYNPRAPPFIA